MGALKVRCAIEVQLDRAYQLVRRRKPFDAVELAQGQIDEKAEALERKRASRLKGEGGKRRRHKSASYEKSPAIGDAG